MNRFIKGTIWGITGVAMLSLLPLQVGAAGMGIGEIPIAGISVTLDRYYTAANEKETETTTKLENEQRVIEKQTPVKEQVAENQQSAKEQKAAKEQKEKEEKEALQRASIDEAYDNSLGIADVDNHLNIRKGPGTSYSIVGHLPKDAGCYIYEIDKDGWAKISSGGVTGYVLTDYLIMGDEAKDYAQEVGYFAATVNTTTLNVRMEPTTDSKILTLIGDSASFEVVEDNTIDDEWIKIKVDDEEGFVNYEFVDIKYQLKKAVPSYDLETDGGSGGGVTSLRASIVAYAKQFLGCPYVWGGNSLAHGVDCSGFTKGIYANFGYYISRTSRTQAYDGVSINISSVRPGDLVFYSSGGTITHVAMYIGNGQIIHASSPRDGIMISNMYYQYPCRAVRIIND